MEMFEVIENVQSFLDLAIESQDVILSLEALNLNVELSLGLDSDLSDREGGSNVLVARWTKTQSLRCFIQQLTHENGLMSSSTLKKK